MYKTDAVEPEAPALPVLTCYHDRKPSLEAVSSNCLVSHRKGHQLHSLCFLMKTQRMQLQQLSGRQLLSLSDVSPGSKNLLAFAPRLSVVAARKDGEGGIFRLHGCFLRMRGGSGGEYGV